MQLISNNTVLSNFAVIDRLDLLKDVYGKIYISLEVYQEIEGGIRHKHLFQKRTKQLADSGEWLLVTGLESKEEELYAKLIEQLHPGEASCLAIAINRKWSFLSDDRSARKLAILYKVPLSGTVGVLCFLRDEKYISTKEANDLLQQMRENGYYSPVSKIEGLFF
jgi:predicted nucleic acid-binding protein